MISNRYEETEEVVMDTLLEEDLVYHSMTGRDAILQFDQCHCYKTDSRI